MDTLTAVLVGIISVLVTACTVVIVCSCVQKICAGPPVEAQPHAGGLPNGGGVAPPAP
ncbi:hypothetical protein SEVIR_9G325233v4 [Setaria viridis]|uniref:Hydrophobic seed protein domain-containing protein n=1 Tax=Setaria viridis TaxID=4556 RepID=A0A4U6T2G5_SETVI|nr:hypothetical protein SEVIR_9G325233v2 [Setaria viridis]